MDWALGFDTRKLQDPALTAKGEARARVAPRALETLWVNTGTLCNLTCRNCYIESSPRNDRLAYLSRAELAGYLDEIERDAWPVRLIGFTGGEPFMNPGLMDMLDDVLSRGLRALVLTTGEDEESPRVGYARLFAELGVPVDAYDPVRLMLFPEMESTRDVPEISTACWSILRKSPDEVMCVSARMVAKRRGADAPRVLACTLLAYDPQFELGLTFAEAARPVALNHPYCASFCVLGGAACSRS